LKYVIPDWLANQYPTEAQLQPLIEQFHIDDDSEKFFFFLDLMVSLFDQSIFREREKGFSSIISI
jgi:hypothetical protein